MIKKSTKIVDLVLNAGGTLFSDQFDEGYFSIDGTGLSILRLKGKAFENWLSRKVWHDLEETLATDCFKEVTRTLEGFAVHDGEIYSLDVRLAKRENVIYYDLGQSIVKIDKKGWEVEVNPPIIFKRLSHQKDQIIPVKEGDSLKILEFLNLANDDQKILFMVNLAAAFIPGFPHPMSVFYGPQGSAKTTATRLIKDIVDPSYVDTLSAPDEIKEFVQQASHHALVSYDNFSYMPDWLSDGLSRTITGAGYSKRELFSNDDDVLYSFQRPIVINGINLVVDKPDLMDRSIFFELDRIPDNKRLDEKSLWKKIDKLKPEILGGIFTAISKAIVIYDQIEVKSMPRMADFYKWGLALSEPLGFPTADFQKAYAQSIENLNDEALEANPVGLVVLKMVNETGGWEGTPQELFEKINTQAILLKIDTQAKYWPKDPRTVWKRIERVKHNLSAKGIKVEKNRNGQERTIRITKATCDDTDDISDDTDCSDVTSDVTKKSL